MSRRRRIKGVATDRAFHALQEQRFLCERGAPVGVDLRLCYFQYLLLTQEPINGNWGKLKQGNRSSLTVSTPCGRILLFLCAQISSNILHPQCPIFTLLFPSFPSLINLCARSSYSIFASKHDSIIFKAAFFLY